MAIERLGPYRIGDPLGRGGMGTVYRGVDEETRQDAAVKVLSSVLASDEAFRERFEAEIETLKTLKHQNIVQLYGYGEQDGHLFYAMELVKGTSLEEELQNGRRFQWQETTRMGIDVCRALKHAHDCGVIHRDLKPANLLLSDNEQIKLTDFGIAKLFGHTQMTAQGGVLGTADYMAPEQAEGRAVTPRSDLYSLGSVMYALLSGRPPFHGKSMGEVLHMLRYADPPPLHHRAPDVPAALEKVIFQLLEKDPQKRIPTALALSNVLQATEHALSLNQDLDDQEPSSRKVHQPGHGFVITSDETIVEATPMVDSKALTRANRSSAKEELQDDVSHETSSSEKKEEKTSERFFTTVDANELGHRPGYGGDMNEGAPWWVKLLIALIGIPVVAFGVWFVTRPLNEEQLYAQIKPILDENQIVEAALAEQTLQQFVRRFPAHVKCTAVVELLEKIKLYRRENFYEKRAKGLVDFHSISPVERAYFEAVRQNEPEEKLAQLQAIVDVFGNQKGHSKNALECLTLADAQARTLRATVDAAVQNDLDTLDERMAQADKLDPQQAARIWCGIIKLYSEKPWAAEIVQRAKQCIGTTQE